MPGARSGRCLVILVTATRWLPVSRVTSSLVFRAPAAERCRFRRSNGAICGSPVRGIPPLDERLSPALSPRDRARRADSRLRAATAGTGATHRLPQGAFAAVVAKRVAVISILNADRPARTGVTILTCKWMLSSDTRLLSDDFSGWEVRSMKNSDRPVPAAAPATQADADAGADSRLRDQVRHSPLPVNLIRLSDGQTLEVSDELVTFAGMDRESLLTKRVADYTEEPEVASASFALLASGALDGYTRKASFRRPDGEVVTFSVWVGACTEHSAAAACRRDHLDDRQRVRPSIRAWRLPGHGEPHDRNDRRTMAGRPDHRRG